jgi:sarcosine oxidase, subunit beta
MLIGSRLNLKELARKYQETRLQTAIYAPGFNRIVASASLLFYASQTAGGHMLLGAEIDRQPSYSYSSGHPFLQSCAHRAMTLLPFLRNLRVLRQWTGVCDGRTGVEGFYITTGWGTWGFKAIPAGGEQMAELIATGQAPQLVAPFSLDKGTFQQLPLFPYRIRTKAHIAF